MGGQLAAAADQSLAAAAHLWPHPEQEGRRSLRVQVPHQHPHPGSGGLEGEVDGGGRLPHATLDAVGGDDLHRLAALPRTSSRAERFALVS